MPLFSPFGFFQRKEPVVCLSFEHMVPELRRSHVVLLKNIILEGVEIFALEEHLRDLLLYSD